MPVPMIEPHVIHEPQMPALMASARALGFVCRSFFLKTVAVNGKPISATAPRKNTKKAVSTGISPEVVHLVCRTNTCIGTIIYLNRIV